MRIMTFRNGLVAGLSTATLLIAVGPSFVPDTTFRGSALDRWQRLRDAEWKASNGEIIGTPKSAAGGWLFPDHGLQDLGLYASLRCSPGCKAGIMVRGQKTQGREKLRRVQRLSRFGEPRQAAAAPPAPAGGRAPNPVAPPPGFASRGGRGPALHPDDWNSVQVTLDADTLRGTLNGSPGLGYGWTVDDSAGFGPVGLYVGGSGEVHSKDLAYKNLSVREEPAGKPSSDFRLQRLDEFYYSWGVAAADINRDGHPDLVLGIGGVLSWAAPDPANPTGQWVVHYVGGSGSAAAHGLGVGGINGDGRPDIITATGWYEQPPKRGTQETWTLPSRIVRRQGRSRDGCV